MTAWTKDELTWIGEVEELQIAWPRRDGRPGRPVTIWVVRVGDALYVRSWQGSTASWFRRVHAHPEGQISAGGIEKQVTVEDINDEAVNNEVDGAYRAKYGHSGYVAEMIRPEARATTLKLEPRSPGRSRRKD
jgi:hypothetical protein